MIKSTDAFRIIDTLLACDHTASIRPDCIHDARQRDARSLLIDMNTQSLESDAAPMIRSMLNIILDDPYATQRLSMMRLDFSLCPMHAIDYAICFDDDDADCATIRNYFPDHDT
jgi:hypothetical protein